MSEDNPPTDKELEDMRRRADRLRADVPRLVAEVRRLRADLGSDASRFEATAKADLHGVQNVAAELRARAEAAEAEVGRLRELLERIHDQIGGPDGLRDRDPLAAELGRAVHEWQAAPDE